MPGSLADAVQRTRIGGVWLCQRGCDRTYCAWVLWRPVIAIAEALADMREAGLETVYIVMMTWFIPLLAGWPIAYLPRGHASPAGLSAVIGLTAFPPTQSTSMAVKYRHLRAPPLLHVRHRDGAAGDEARNAWRGWRRISAWLRASVRRRRG